MTPEQFAAAFAAAKGGEIIDCGGAQLGALSISRRKFPEAVTIRNFIAGTIYVGASENLILEDFIMDFVPTAATSVNSPAFRITTSSRIKIRKGRLAGRPSEFGLPPETLPGTDNPGGNILGLPSAKGLDISFSSFIDIEENDISNFYKGITFGNTDDLNILLNEIHHLRSSAMTGGAINRAMFRGNHAHTSTPWKMGGDGDHGDYLHIFQNPKGTGKTMFDITAVDNFFSQGDSATSLLGIYLDNNGLHDRVKHPDLYDADGQPKNGFGYGFGRVLIDNNILFMGHGLGLLLDNVEGVARRNTLAWSGKGNQRTNDERDAPRIHATAREGGELLVEKNVSAGLAIKLPERIMAADNLDIRRADYPDMFIDALKGRPTLADLQPLPGGALDTAGIGARLTAVGPGAGLPMPVPAPEPTPEPIPEPVPVAVEPSPQDTGEATFLKAALARAEKIHDDAHATEKTARTARYAAIRQIEEISARLAGLG